MDTHITSLSPNLHTAVFMLAPPEPNEGRGDGVTITSYVIPSATLAVASHPNRDYYDVKFEVCQLYNIA